MWDNKPMENVKAKLQSPPKYQNISSQNYFYI